MLSEKHHFLFIHRPKSAGNSISRALLPYSEEKAFKTPYHDGKDEFILYHPKYKSHKHNTLKQYQPKFSPAFFKRLFKFVVLRNPYERMVSSFFSPSRVVRGVDTSFTPEKFTAWVGQCCDLRGYICLNDDEPLDAHMDMILRFENLKEDFAELCDRLLIDQVSLGHLNKSKHSDYQDYYTPELRRLVERRFAEEIEYGKYVF